MVVGHIGVCSVVPLDDQLHVRAPVLLLPRRIGLVEDPRYISRALLLRAVPLLPDVPHPGADFEVPELLYLNRSACNQVGGDLIGADSTPTRMTPTRSGA